jgi:SNF2 family DNA or RNA helicase
MERSKKRTFDQFKNENTKPAPQRRKKLLRNVDCESQTPDSTNDKEVGGSNENFDNSNIIDNFGVSPPKQSEHDSDGVESRVLSKNRKQEIEPEVESEEEYDIYEKLDQYADGHEQHGYQFKYYSKKKRFYLPGDFSLPSSIYLNLFEHQKTGIEWLYNLWDQKKGGVLGDDMGLGKTVQVAVYLNGLFEAEMIHKIMVVVPATMKMYWEEELSKWCPSAP